MCIEQMMAWIFLTLSSVIIFIFYKIYMKQKMGKCRHTTDMSGKTVIVTGANRGIGYEVALHLAKRNARVIIGCKSENDGEVAAMKIRQLTGNSDIKAYSLDLSSFASVRQFIDTIKKNERRLDVLINNAGISGHPKQMTSDGCELNMSTNYFGPFLLTTSLLDLLKQTAPSRVIFTSSIAHKWGNINLDNLNAEKSFFQGTVYFDTKLAVTMFCMELDRRLQGTGVTSNALHPGSVHTGLLEKLPLPVWAIMEVIQTLFFRTVTEGAQTTIYLAVAPELEKISGKYFSECQLDTPSQKAMDRVVAKKLWDISETITGHK